MPEPLGENQPITDEQRQAVRKLLFDMLRASDPTLKDDTDVFQFQFIMPNGKVTINFEPGDEFLDWAIRTSDRVIRETLIAATNTLVTEGKIDSETASDPLVQIAFEKKNPEMFAASFAYVTMQNMIPKLKSAFSELALETIKIYEGIVFLGMERSHFDEHTGFQIPDLTKLLTTLSKDLADTRKKQLLKTIKRFTGEPRLELLAPNYPNLLTIWQDVKKIYRANNETETWREMVKAKYPDLAFDDDLLTRITAG